MFKFFKKFNFFELNKKVLTGPGKNCIGLNGFTLSFVSKDQKSTIEIFFLTENILVQVLLCLAIFF